MISKSGAERHRERMGHEFEPGGKNGTTCNHCARDWQRKRYTENPEWREKRKTQLREAHARRKAKAEALKGELPKLRAKVRELRRELERKEGK